MVAFLRQADVAQIVIDGASGQKDPGRRVKGLQNQECDSSDGERNHRGQRSLGTGNLPENHLSLWSTIAV